MDSLQINNEQALEYLRPTQEKGKRKSKRSAFRPGWVRLPVRWAEALRQSRSVRAYQLAHTILIEAFKQRQSGWDGRIVLSTKVTGMPRNTKVRAVNELVRLGLIKVGQDGNQAVRIIKMRTR
jgi:hypothetical protein